MLHLPPRQPDTGDNAVALAMPRCTRDDLREPLGKPKDPSRGNVKCGSLRSG